MIVFSFVIEHRDELPALRRQVRVLVQELGFDLLDQVRVCVAVTECAHLCLEYALCGRLDFSVSMDQGRQILYVCYTVQGRAVDALFQFLQGKSEHPVLSGLERLVDLWQIDPPAGDRLLFSLGRALPARTLTFENSHVRSVRQRLKEFAAQEDACQDIELYNHDCILALVEQLNQQKDFQHMISKVKEYETYGRTVMQNLPDAVCLIQDGCCRFANPALSNFLGMEAEELIDRPVLDFIHPDDRDKVQKILAAHLAGRGAPEIFEVRTQDARGRTAWIEVRAVLAPWQGRAAVLTLARDVTRNKAMQDLVGLQGKALDAAANAMVITDCQGDILWANPAFCHLTGYALDEVLGKNPRMFKSGRQDEAFYARMWQTITSGHVWQGSLINRRKDGSLYHEEMTITPVRDQQGRVTHFIAVKQDVTERKRSEDSLASSRKELELSHARLQESYRLAAGLAKKAQEASELKSRFLANMSHELRTPLNGVLGMISMLMRTGLTSQQMDYARLIEQNGKILLELINDILEFSRLEAGRVEILPYDADLYSLVEQAVDLMAVSAHEKGLDLQYVIDPQVPVWVKVDAGRLRQVLMNLLANALKFTTQGRVLLTVNRQGEENGLVLLRFAVEDTGVGIAKDKQDKLFESFYQVDSSVSSEVGGSGLGLAICRELVSLMGGELSVQSTLGQGSCFFFTLHLAPGEPREPEDMCSKGQGLLLIMSSEEEGERVRLLFRSWECSAEVVYRAEDACTLLEQARQAGRSFDLLIADEGLGETVLLELAEALRSRHEWSDIGLAVLASMGRELSEAWRQAGFVQVLYKPLTRDRLRVCLQKVRDKERQMQHLDREGRQIEQDPYSKKADILVAEDNPSNQMVIRAMLEHFGFEPDVVNNGQEALAALRQKKYDLVLMDCRMPVMDGFAATRAIRDRSTELLDHDLPIIALTAHALHGDREYCLEQGMNDYLAKPVMPEQLIQVLHKWLGSREQQQSGEQTVSSRMSCPGYPAAPCAGGKKTSLVDFDEQSLTERLSGDQELIKGLFEVFWANLEQHLADIRQGLDTGDADQVFQAVHAFKGAAGNVAALRLHSVLQEMESLTLEGKLEDVASRWKELLACVDRLRKLQL